MSPESPFSPEKGEQDGQSKVKQRWDTSREVKIAKVHNVISSLCNVRGFPADPLFAVNTGTCVLQVINFSGSIDVMWNRRLSRDLRDDPTTLL